MLNVVDMVDIGLEVSHIILCHARHHQYDYDDMIKQQLHLQTLRSHHFRSLGPTVNVEGLFRLKNITITMRLSGAKAQIESSLSFLFSDQDKM